VNGNLRGILAMTAATSVFIVNDMLMKLVAETAQPVQAIGVRGVFATLWVGLALAWSGAWRQLGGLSDGRIVLRTGIEVVGTFAYLLALFHIPIGVATAINLAVPLALTALAVIFLKEDVRWRRWAAVIAGFVGVLLVIRPLPGEFNLWSWLVLGATFLHAARDLLTRLVPQRIPSLIITFATAAAVAIAGCGWAAVQGWQPMSSREIGLIALASVLVAAGYQLVIVAMRVGEVSVVGSFRYSSIVWALLIGWIVWGEVPDLWGAVGIAIIVGSGLYILHRESVRAERA